jgi:uncharacterized protein (DUF1015 family)
MAQIEPFRAVRYDTNAAGALENLVAPPYDVIDAQMRRELTAKSPFNVVEIDLPEASGDDSDPYLHACTTYEAWEQQGILVREREPAIWIMRQQYRLRGETMNRTGFFCRVRIEDYGPGKIRPHERTHPGPKEDRMKLMKATRANLSPIFSLFDDPGQEVWDALQPHADDDAPFATAVDADGIANRLWRVADETTIEHVQRILSTRELLIADGHHRYETARQYAADIGGEGEHQYVLMFLVAMQDPGMTILPTHRLLTDVKTSEAQETLGAALKRDFDIEQIEAERLEPEGAEAPTPAFGYMDSFFKRPYRLTLKDQAIADEAMPGKPEPYRRLDTAVLESLVLRGALGMTEDDISHLNGLAYSKDFDHARQAVESGEADCAFFMRGTPIEQVRQVAEAGETMPPKSTFFYPKIPTGLLISPLE